MQNFFSKSKILGKGNAEPQPQEAVFQAADPDLDLFTQARMNLRNFKDFFDTGPSNASEPYQTVAASISKAFANLTNKSAELELEKESHEKDMKSLLEDIKAQESELETTTQFVAEMKNRVEILKNRNTLLKSQLTLVTSRLNKRRMAKKKFIAINYQFQDLASTLAFKKEKLAKKQKENKEIMEEYKLVKAEFDTKEDKINEELVKSEQRVKELQIRAKKIEQEQEEARQKAQNANRKKMTRKQSMSDSNCGTFIIQDNLAVSNREIDGLREMVQAIEKENDVLSDEYESKQMDVDCLMQQNLGLKQIIRDIMEPNG